MKALQQPLLRLAPITGSLTPNNLKILLGGSHQPSLLRYLDGWPKRWGKPRELAGAAIYLASEASSFVTGQQIVADGGTSAQM